MSQSFALVATGALMSVFLMMRSKNPVHSVFYLVLLFLHCSGLLVLLGLEYFVLLQLLVYVGALAILFLFVVMLLDIPSTEILAHQRGTYPVAGVLAFCLLIAGTLALWQPLYNSVSVFGNTGAMQYSFWHHYRTATSTVANLGIALYGVHADLLIIASLLLLVAMIGAVGLTLKRPVSVPNQDVFAQHYVDFQKVVVQIPGTKSTAVFNSSSRSVLHTAAVFSSSRRSAAFNSSRSAHSEAAAFNSSSSSVFARAFAQKHCCRSAAAVFYSSRSARMRAFTRIRQQCFCANARFASAAAAKHCCKLNYSSFYLRSIFFYFQ